MGFRWCFKQGCFGKRREPDIDSLNSEPGPLLPAGYPPDPGPSCSSSERRHLRNWLKISEDYDFDEAYAADNVRFRNRMALRGVPASMRWRVWRAVAGCSEIFKPGLYEEVRLAVTLNVRWSFERRPDDNDHFDVISASGRSLKSGDVTVDSSERERIEEIVSLVKQDLGRTFPFSQFYSDDKNLARLGNVLVSYAALNKEVGYCQGMNFLAGLLLQQSDSERETFWMLTLVMTRYNLQSLYSEDIPLLHLLKYQFSALLNQLFPEISAHFDRLYVLPELYAVKWFFSLFAYSFPENLVFPLWDFRFAGCPPHQRHTGVSRAILLLALGLLKISRSKLLKCSCLQSVLNELEAVRSVPSVEPLLAAARSLDLKVHQASLEGLRGHWAELYPQANEQICRGEMVALLMPAAVLEWEGIRREHLE